MWHAGMVVLTETKQWLGGKKIIKKMREWRAEKEKKKKTTQQLKIFKKQKPKNKILNN
jgi:hypothetical protein